MPSSKNDTPETVEVTTILPLTTLFETDPEELRKMLGEEVYKQALLKVQPPDEPRERKVP